MHTRASNSELVEQLPEPEPTLNQRLRRQNMRVPFEQRNEPPPQPRVVYVIILDINYFCHFLDILENYNPMDNEPIWAADRVVTPTPGFAITILETANEFSIKGNHLTLVKGNQFEGMPNYGKFLKELVSNKHKLEQISAVFLSDESSALIQNKVSPKLGEPRSSLIPCNFNKAFSFDALADHGASINLMPYSLYAKLYLKTLKPTKMSIRLADRSFQYPVGIAKNMLVEIGKFTFLVDFIILKMEEDSKAPLIIGRPFLHTADAIIRVKQKQLNLRVETKHMTFHMDSVMKYSYSNDDTCFRTILEEKLFAEFDEFIAMTIEEKSKFESENEESLFEKITFNTDYKMKTSLEEPPTDLELKPLSHSLEYVFLEEPSFLPVIISS
ncbi:reverse transcriptase domain-containing protein [Tanacetum coccineum]